LSGNGKADERTVTTAVPPLYLDGGNLSLQWVPPYSVAPVVTAQDRATNVALTFSITVHVGAMAVDNMNIAGLNLSALSPIECVEWKSDIGTVEQIGSRLRTNFTDITPYCPYLQMFMANCPGITLAQAQKIQCDATDALFVNKHQQPLYYSVAAGAYWWDASDSSVAHFNAAMQIAIADLVTQINGYIVDEANPALDTIDNSGATIANHLSSTVLGSYINGQLPPAGPNTLNNLLQSASNVATPGLGGNIPGIAWSGSSSYRLSHVSPSTLNVVPMGATGTVTVNVQEMGQILDAIHQRRNSLLITGQSKKNAINALTTISAVIAYDVTAGW